MATMYFTSVYSERKIVVEEGELNKEFTLVIPYFKYPLVYALPHLSSSTPFLSILLCAFPDPYYYRLAEPVGRKRAYGRSTPLRPPKIGKFG